MNDIGALHSTISCRIGLIALSFLSSYLLSGYTVNLYWWVGSRLSWLIFVEPYWLRYEMDEWKLWNGVSWLCFEHWKGWQLNRFFELTSTFLAFCRLTSQIWIFNWACDWVSFWVMWFLKKANKCLMHGPLFKLSFVSPVVLECKAKLV